MNNKKILQYAIVFTLIALLLSGCGPGQMFGPTQTPIPPTSTNTPVPPTATNTPVPPTATNTPVPPTATNTPVPPTPTELAYPPFPSEINTSGTIKTSLGPIKVVKAEIVSKDVSGTIPRPGYQIVQIWFTGVDPDGFFDALEGVYLVGDDGSQTKRYSGGGVNNKLLAAFIVPTSAKKFWLYWPENLPVELKLN